jgi:hypothetical protein
MFLSGRGLRRSGITRGAAAGAAALVAGLLIAGVPSTKAGASTVFIDQFNTGGSRCWNDLKTTPTWCLWYSPNMDGGVLTHSYDISTLSENFGNGGYGTAGVGLPVRNDAASMANNNGACLYTYVYPGYVGDDNGLEPWWGGNLTANLRNNEASIRWAGC